jgi:hypothetical protein
MEDRDAIGLPVAKFGPIRPSGYGSSFKISNLSASCWAGVYARITPPAAGVLHEN